MTTITGLLFTESTESAQQERLLNSLTASTDLAQQLMGAYGVPVAQVIPAIWKLLDMPAGNLAIRGWGKHREVSAAMNQTKDRIGDRRVVRLAEHSIKSKQTPTIDASVAGASKTVLVLDLEVEIEVASVDLIIEQGEIVDSIAGGAVAKAKLSASGVTLAEREFSPIELDRTSGYSTSSQTSLQ